MQIKELGHVVLYVSDLERSADFYGRILGFREIARVPGAAVYSSGRTHHELMLLEIGGPEGARRAPEPGLYHIGFKVGDSTEELRAAYRELLKENVQVVGSADHHVTHSLYVLDPDGTELELYADVSDDWKTDPGAVMAPTRPLAL